MIEFTLTDGNPIAINLALVDYIQPADDLTFVAFNDGREISIIEDYADVAAALGIARAGEVR